MRLFKHGKSKCSVRGRYLFKLHHLLMTNKEELARLITLENGKSLSESLGEVQRGIENVEHAASITNLIMGDSLSQRLQILKLPITVIPSVLLGNYSFQFSDDGTVLDFPNGVSSREYGGAEAFRKTPLLMEKLLN